MFLEILLGKLAGNFAWAPLPFLETPFWKHLLENLFWEPCFAWKNMFPEILLRKLAGNLAWTPLPGNTFLETLA